MQIGRLAFGITKWHIKPSWIEKWLYVGANKTFCGCYEVSISIFYITWLSDECSVREEE